MQEMEFLLRARSDAMKDAARELDKSGHHDLARYLHGEAALSRKLAEYVARGY